MSDQISFVDWLDRTDEENYDSYIAERRGSSEVTAKLTEIRNVIPMNFLRAKDAPGATGPTDALDLVGAVREIVSAGRRLGAKLSGLSGEEAKTRENAVRAEAWEEAAREAEKERVMYLTNDLIEQETLILAVRKVMRDEIAKACRERAASLRKRLV